MGTIMIRVLRLGVLCGTLLVLLLASTAGAAAHAARPAIDRIMATMVISCFIA